MAGNDAKGIKDEVDNRLSELFGETPAEAAPGKKAAPDPAKFAQFKELKALMLSVEWEITDESMVRFLKETERLQDVHRGNPIVLSFLKLLGSVGKYVANKKAQAHPDSITLLHSIYENFETVSTSSSITEPEIKKILSEEIKKFKLLREKLMGQPAPAPEKGAKTPEKSKAASKATEEEIDLDSDSADKKTSPAPVETGDTAPLVSDLSPSPDVLMAQFEALKKIMTEEFESIRKEIEALKK